MPPRARKDFTSGLRSGMGQFSSNGSAMIVRAKLLRVKPTSDPEEVVAFVRVWYANAATARLKWSLRRGEGHWRLYDGEELGSGMSMSTAMGMALAPAMQNMGAPGLPRWTKSMPLLRQAYTELFAQDYPAAQKSLKLLDAVEFPPPIEAQKLAAHAQFESAHGNFERALAFCDRAEAFNKEMPLLSLLRAIAHNGLGQADQGYKFARMYVDALGEDAEVLHELGRAMEMQGRIPEARDAYARGYADDPSHVVNLAGLARTIGPDDRARLADMIGRAANPKQAYAVVAAQLHDPESLEAMNRAYAKLPSLDRDEVELTYHKARQSLYAGKAAEAAGLVRPLLDNASPEQRPRFAAFFCEAATAAGQYRDAYLAMEDRLGAFGYVARELLKREDAEGLKAVIALHAREHSDDYLLPYYRGEVKMIEKDFAGAVDQFAAALAGAPSAQEAQGIRTRHLFARYKAGQSYLAYRDSPEKAATFEQIASFCVDDENADVFASLFAAHRSLIRDPVDLGWNQARLHFVRKEYADAVDVLNGLREPILKREPLRGPAFRNMMIRSLIRQKRFAAARAELQEPEAPHPAPFYELLIAAAMRDPASAQLAMKGLPPEVVPVVYEDPDIGPAMRSAEFAALRAKYPQPRAAR